MTTRDSAAPTARPARATSPAELPAGAWRAVAGRIPAQIRTDRLPLAAAGVAFYGLLAIFPALIAVVSVYGLFGDAAAVEQQITEWTSTMRGGAGALVREQAQRIVEVDRAALSVSFAVTVLVALWSASSGVHGLMQALSIAYDVPEDRGLLRRRAIALALTLLTLVVFAAAIAVIVAVPVALRAAGAEGAVIWVLRVLRWVLMAGVLAAAMAMLYRYGPSGPKPDWRWVMPGVAIATVLWILGSLGFSVYVANFGSYNETYGALAGVVVLLLWLFLSAFFVLLGAEVNAEAERERVPGQA